MQSTASETSSEPRAPPGPRGLPLVGNTHQWIRDPCRFRERLAAEYGPVVNYEIIGMDAYMLTDPDDVERVLVRESDRFRKHQGSNDQLSELLGDGLVTSEGDLWKRQREAIQPAFYVDKIRRYADVMVDRSAARADAWTPGEPVDVKAELMRTTLEIIVEAMFGRGVDLEERGIFEAAEDVHGPLEPSKQPITFLAPDWAPIPFLRRARAALDHLEGELADIIARRRASEDERDDLLSVLLAVDDEMTDEQLRDELLTFLFAGHETTALTLTFALDLLTRNPEAADRLREELDDVLGADRPSFDDVFAFEYAEAVVREAMRLYPPAHEIRREPVEDVAIGDYRIPEGSLVVLPTWVLHRDERFWTDPEAFRPERWLDPDDDRRDSSLRDPDERPEFAYFPFGGGPRHCIGHRFAMTEAQLVLATLCSEYTFERRYDDFDLSASVTLQPKGELEMVPRRR